MSTIAMSALRARGALFAGAKISSVARAKVGTTSKMAAPPRAAAAAGDERVSRALRTINTSAVKAAAPSPPTAEAEPEPMHMSCRVFC